MSLLKPKIFIPLCIAGILTGYAAAEYVVPRYFHPTAATKLTAQDLINAIGAQPNYFRQTTSGNYLAGQFAQRHKDWGKASEYMTRVLKREKENPDLEKHSMILYMAAGDADTSINIAKNVLTEEPENLLAVLFTSIDYLKKQDYKTALKTYDQIKDQNIAAFIVPILKLWAEASNNELNTQNLTPNSFYAYQVMLAGIYLNKQDDALAFAQKSFKAEDNDIRDLEKHADLFSHYGENKTALEIYKLIEDNNFAHEDILEKIELLTQNKSINHLITLPTISAPEDGSALVFQDMAEILLREMSDDSATIFAQMALHLNSKLYKNNAIIGEVYKRYERYDSAIEALKKIPPQSDIYPEIQRQIAELYAEQDKEDKAVEILQNLYQNNNDIDALIQIGDIYRYQENFEQSKDVYTTVLKEWNEVPEEYWHVLYARGMVLERLKEFKAAEDDLQQALDFRPDNPYLLNYLGYSWVDQGINLDKSLDMITRAVAFKPNDGYITDSLGWVFYKMGKYAEAVPHLERAVELLPYDATINDHLGDAYWQVDRKNEARFQWQRALNYNEDKDAELKEIIEKKLISGITDETQEQASENSATQKTEL